MRIFEVLEPDLNTSLTINPRKDQKTFRLPRGTYLSPSSKLLDTDTERVYIYYGTKVFIIFRVPFPPIQIRSILPQLGLKQLTPPSRIFG